VTQGEELRHWREGLDAALRAPIRRRRPLKVLALSLVLLVVAGTAGAFAYWRVIGGLFDRTNVNLAPASGKALNIILVGSDSREGLTTPEDVERFGEVGGKRSDTIILAQLIPREQRGVLVSFPRDLYIPIHEGERQYWGKINSAYGSGPQTLIDTVGALTGVPINHYMEIDIRGFRAMVDAIGGIDITQDVPLYDSKLNFRLPKGTSHLDGNSALSFVRARHATPGGDFDRIKRQQQFLRVVMSKVGRPSVLGNPVRVNQLARAFAANVKVDQYFQLDDLVRFALSVRRVGQDQLETYSVPGTCCGRVNGESIVRYDEAQAAPLFQALRDAEDPHKTVPAQASGG
jgi:LCP family protein required for cell wall assembly